MAGACATDGGGRGNGGAAEEFMLFGVRVVVDSMRKSVSLNNLSQYEHPHHHHQESPKEDLTASGYASADDAVPRASGSRSERRRGVPWTEEEHKLFLLGLQKVGKGDWRGISRKFVKTRTPTQVASHAQKYFLRQSNRNRRRRRTSLFDITTDTVTEAQVSCNNTASQAHPLLPSSETSSTSNFSANNNPVALPIQIESPVENLSLIKANQAISSTTNLICPISSIPATHASPVHDFDLNLMSADDLSSPLSLKLSTSFNNGDNIMIVA